MDAKWVNVNDRLPEDHKSYYIKYNSGSCQAFYNKESGWCTNGRILDSKFNVTEWLEIGSE